MISKDDFSSNVLIFAQLKNIWMHATSWKWFNKYLHVYFLNCILWGMKNLHTFTLFSLIWSCISDLSSHLESDALGGFTARIFNTCFSCVRAPFVFSASGDWWLFIKRIFSRFAKHFWERLTGEKKMRRSDLLPEITFWSSTHLLFLNFFSQLIVICVFDFFCINSSLILLRPWGGNCLVW